MEADDKIKFKEIYLRLTEAQFEDWIEMAKLKNFGENDRNSVRCHDFLHQNI